MGDINCDYTDDVVCPYCGCEFTDSWEYNSAEGEEVECNCGKRFLVTANHSVTYSSQKIDCKEPHLWAEAHDFHYTQDKCDRHNSERKPDSCLPPWTPHTIWVRECTECDKEEYKEVPLGEGNPWLNQGGIDDK